MKITKILLAFLCTVIMFTGCTIKKDTVMTINDQEITRGQYNKLFDEHIKRSSLPQMSYDVKKDPDNFINIMVKDRVVNELIVKTLLDQDMAKKHITVSNEEVNQEIKNLIDKFGSKEKFNEILKQNGLTPNKLKDDLKEEIKIKKLVGILDLVTINDIQAKKFYDKNKDKFAYPDKVRAAHILISANPEELRAVITSSDKGTKLTEAEIKAQVDKLMAEKKQKAEAILAELKLDPSKFATIAREKSEDPTSAKAGGDLGYFTKEAMVPEFAKAAFALKPNRISELVKTQYGYHIIIVNDRVKAGTEPFDKVKDDIKMYLENEKKAEILQKYIETLRKNAKITYEDPSFNPETIAKALKEQIKKNPALMDMQKPAGE